MKEIFGAILAVIFVGSIMFAIYYIGLMLAILFVFVIVFTVVYLYMTE